MFRIFREYRGEEQEIVARKDSDGNWYIEKDTLNGKPYNPDTATETERNVHRIVLDLTKQIRV